MVPGQCLCGCGETVGASALYRPGHDARHASAVGRRLQVLGSVDPALLEELPSPALRAKAVRMLGSAPRGSVDPGLGASPGAGVPEPVHSAPAPIDPRSTAELLQGYAQILAELRSRGVLRSNNAPAGDYGEWIAVRALGGDLVDHASVKSYDLTTRAGERVQVKTRVVGARPSASQLQTSAFRSWDFEHAALVLLRAADYQVHRAVKVPVDVVRSRAVRVEHVNGWRVSMTSDLLDHLEAVDFTAAARSAAAGA